MQVDLYELWSGTQLQINLYPGKHKGLKLWVTTVNKVCKKREASGFLQFFEFECEPEVNGKGNNLVGGI